jgi:N-acetylglucosaminyldiphosphoundecaprenol N-acetyl-beta-D-mannosaminyltransferase
MNELKILDVKINNITKSKILQKISQLLNSSEIGRQLCTTNPEFIIEAQKNPEFKQIINNSWLSIADGYGIRLAGKWLYKKNIEIITGVDLVYDISEICAEKNKKIFLLGGFDDVPKLTAKKLTKKYKLKINFSTFENTEKVAKIKEFQPDILLVAVGHPRAQIWINKNLQNFQSVKLAIGVGGSFDYISGKIKRAPKSWRSHGLEWLYRLIHQPKRLKRIWNAWIVFSWKVFINSIK